MVFVKNMGRERGRTGQEIRRTLPEPWIHECFVIVQERIWVRQKRNIIHEELLFPGCVFSHLYVIRAD